MNQFSKKRKGYIIHLLSSCACNNQNLHLLCISCSMTHVCFICEVLEKHFYWTVPFELPVNSFVVVRFIACSMFSLQEQAIHYPTPNGVTTGNELHWVNSRVAFTLNAFFLMIDDQLEVLL